MSALGHKRTYAPQQAMSALHPIATTKADMCAAKRHVCFTPHKSVHVRRNWRCQLWATHCDTSERYPVENEMRIIGRLVARGETLSASDPRSSHRPESQGN